MVFTEQARGLLRQLEGCRLTAYQDGAGVWTIGYGHTGPDVHAGLTWTQAGANAALDVDLGWRISGVQKLLVPVMLSGNQFSALVIFAFNTGLTALAGSTALRDIKAGHLDLVPAALALWDKIHDASGVPVVSPGLVNRRNAEIALWNTPDEGGAI